MRVRNQGEEAIVDQENAKKVEKENRKKLKQEQKAAKKANKATKKKKKIWPKILITLLFLIVILIIVASGFVIGISDSVDLFDLLDGDLVKDLPLTTFIYDKDGNEIDRIWSDQNRVMVKYEDMPTQLVDAIVAIEDERYFEHDGVDTKRTFGAIATYIFNKGDSSYGGSTITQQLVKNLTKDDATSVERKIREWYRANSLESHYSKEEIFDAYANTIYFGAGAYGVDVAAKTYFNKPLKELSLPECAVLAAAIQSPEGTNPYSSEEAKQRLIDREKVVLKKMLDLGKITTEQYAEAVNTEVTFQNGVQVNKVHSYYVESAIDQVISDLQNSKGITYDEAKKLVYTGGYKIYTNINQGIQNVVDSVYQDKKIFYTEKDGSMMQSAMVVMDHTNGNVLAISGGAGSKNANFVLNRATQSYRQPGSCMKPFGAYGPAFERGTLSPSSILEDSPLTIGDWSPKNYYGYFKGRVTVRQAVAMSMNIPAVRANLTVDNEFAFNFAKDAGLKSLLPSDKYTAPLSLGGLTKGVTPLELANAYATIANGGVYNSPKFYSKVVKMEDNSVVLEKKSDAKTVMKDTTASSLTLCLQDVVTTGTGAGYIKTSNNMPIAGKTGNTNDDKDQWFCGFTPYYTIACWNGYDTPRPIGYRAYGSYPYTSMTLFTSVMNEISKGQEIKPLNTSKVLEEVKVCKETGLLANYGCYAKGTVESKMVAQDSKPTEYCNAHNNFFQYYHNNYTTNAQDNVNKEQQNTLPNTEQQNPTTPTTPTTPNTNPGNNGGTGTNPNTENQQEGH